MGFIDCDSHVIESESTWEYFDPKEAEYKPRIVEFQDVERSYIQGMEVVSDVPPQRLWIFEDAWARQFPRDGNVNNKCNIFGESTVDGGNAAARIEDMDALGIDFQVLISSFFISAEIEQALPEAAYARSYNRWMADVTSNHHDRLGWTLRPPLRLLNRALEELHFGRENGAVGIHLRGIEHGMFLSNPYFYPLYEEAQELDLTMVVHIGNSGRRSEQMGIGKTLRAPEGLMEHLNFLMTGFWAVLASDLHERFPRLRWAFVEGGSTWAPAVLQQHARLRVSADHMLDVVPITPEELVAKNIFIACETDEDLPYLVKILGEDVLVTGTDYGHNDIGSEIGAHQKIMSRHDLDPSAARKIVDVNGRRLFPIDDEFRPATIPSRDGSSIPHVRGARSEDGKALLAIGI